VAFLSKSLTNKVVRALAFCAVLIALWQGLALAEVWPPYIFPGPGGVLDSLVVKTTDGTIPQAVAISLTRLLVGYAISFMIGAAIGLLIGIDQWADDTLGSLVLGFQSLPSITWLPLAILWFGLNDTAIIFVVLMGSLFSVAISVRAGVRGIPPLLTRAALVLGADRRQLYRYVVLPGMLPALLQGLKLGWSFAWRSLMAGELLFVSLGIGHLLNLGRDLNDMGMVVAAMLVIVAVGLTVDRLVFGRLESWVQHRWGFAAAY
jgi:NitT/TauT family transport system permease protein